MCVWDTFERMLSSDIGGYYLCLVTMGLATVPARDLRTQPITSNCLSNAVRLLEGTFSIVEFNGFEGFFRGIRTIRSGGSRRRRRKTGATPP